MSELSPAAQAVLDAYRGRWDYDLAAALRAAVDQVVPEMPTPWNSTLTPKVSAENVRAQLLAIADELEAQ
jgi:hypothetical protein